MREGLLLVIAFGLLFPPTRFEQVSTSIATQPVTRDVLERAAEGGAGDFAQSLARAHIRAGIILPPASVFEVHVAKQRPGLEGSLTLGRALELFTAANDKYIAEEHDGALLLVPRGSACRARLNTRLSAFRVSAPLFEALFRLMRAVDPTLPDVPPGMVGGGGAQSPAHLFTRPVSVDLKDVSIAEALMKLTGQVPGVVWGIRENPADPRRRCNLTYFDGISAVATSYDIK